MVYLIEFLYFVIPIGAVVFFFVTLSKYLTAKRQERFTPGSVDPRRLKTLKILLILSAIVAAVLAAVVIGFIVILFMAIAFM